MSSDISDTENTAAPSCKCSSIKPNYSNKHLTFKPHSIFDGTIHLILYFNDGSWDYLNSRIAQVFQYMSNTLLVTLFFQTCLATNQLAGVLHHAVQALRLHLISLGLNSKKASISNPINFCCYPV